MYNVIILPSHTVKGMSNSSSKITGRSLIRAGWSTLSDDRELLALPLLGGVISIFVVIPFGGIYFLIPDEAGLLQWVPIIAGMLLYNLIIVFFAVALAAGAVERMNGGDPTVSSSMRVAWSRRSGIFQWSLLTTAFGLLLRIIEQRLPTAGKFISALGGLTWAIASYFVIPVIAVENVSGFDALRSSARVIKERWGKVLRFNLRILIYQFIILVPTIVLVINGVLISQRDNNPLAVLLIVVALLFLFSTSFLVSAVVAIARVALYRYAVGMPVPGFDSSVLERAVKSA
jgi:hypothetical protein